MGTGQRALGNGQWATAKDFPFALSLSKGQVSSCVMPAQAGIQSWGEAKCQDERPPWIPAFAGMTNKQPCSFRSPVTRHILVTCSLSQPLLFP